MALRRGVLLAGLCLCVSGCYREVVVTKQMTWECVPAQDRADYPGQQTVLFRYVENPSYEETEPGLHLCDQLRASGRPVADVRITVFGDPWDGMRGYRTEAINGKPLESTGPWGSSGMRGNAQGKANRFPLDGLIPRHQLR